MANENNGKDTERADYAPEWITKSIDKLPPSEGLLAENPVVDAILGVEKPSGNGAESGNVEPPSNNGDSSH